MDVNLNNTDNNDYVRGYKDGKVAGTTAENDKAQPLADLLEMIKTLGPVDTLTIKLIDKRLKEWKGKEVDNEQK